jgi:hypothetical protein
MIYVQLLALILWILFSGFTYETFLWMLQLEVNVDNEADVKSALTLRILLLFGWPLVLFMYIIPRAMFCLFKSITNNGSNTHV